MLKRLIGILFEVIMVLLMIYTAISFHNYVLTHNIVTAQIVGIADSRDYVVYKDTSIVIENTYNMAVGDELRVNYDEDKQEIELIGAGKYLMLCLISLFACLVGVLLMLDYNTYLIISTILVYMVDVFIIAPYSDGIMLLKSIGTICNYCKPIAIWLIVLNSVLLIGYFLNFGINFAKEKKALMLQSKI